MTRRFSFAFSVWLSGGLLASACAGPKFTPEAECDACEGGAAGATDRVGRGGATGGGAAATGGGAGKGGAAGASATGGDSGNGSGGTNAGTGALAGAGGSVAGSSGTPVGGSAGVAGDGAGGTSGIAGSSAGGSGGAEPSGFPLTELLDDFENPDEFSENWRGSLDDFTVADGVLSCNDCPHAALHAESLDARDQEVFVSLAGFESDAAEINLILLAQNEVCELVEVLYSPARQVLEVHTCYFGIWEPHGSTQATLAAGDRFGARLHADGTVQVFVNGVERLSAALGALENDDGYIGVSGNTTSSIAFDDFGGGVWR